MLRDNALTELRKKFEKAKKERDDLKLTLEKFENSPKNLSKLLDSQVSDKFKTGVGYDSQVFDSQVFNSQVNDKYKTCEGYHAVSPPYTGNFMPPKLDLVLVDKDEYVFSESVTSVPTVAPSEVKTSESKPKSVSEPLIEDWISDSENENETEESVKKVENNKQTKYPGKNNQSPKGNKRNWNNLMTQKSRKNCGKPEWNNARRVNHQNSQRMSHPHPKRNFVPKAILIKSSLKTLNTARQNSSGGRGLRQGDPMSPYLFTLVMEILTLIIQRKIRDRTKFKYHQGCNDLQLINLCFADDWMIFCHGDAISVSIVKEAIEEFSDISGLHPITTQNFHQ
ncbi:ribonuclease H-like domain-containing protein [Tanacetum coccineum]|uniref:Ribonuclease H-like domain-containing protein n=1 Tax=Tanacetum coccineum TaxID=301880 RepID=A0ABQ5FEQ0_9ASTR